MKKLTFRQSTLTLLHRHFGLRQTFSSQLLDQWLHDEQPMLSRTQTNKPGSFRIDVMGI